MTLCWCHHHQPVTDAWEFFSAERVWLTLVPARATSGCPKNATDGPNENTFFPFIFSFLKSMQHFQSSWTCARRHHMIPALTLKFLKKLQRAYTNFDHTRATLTSFCSPPRCCTKAYYTFPESPWRDEQYEWIRSKIQSVSKKWQIWTKEKTDVVSRLWLP